MADSKAGKFTSKEVLGRPDSVLAREDVCLKQEPKASAEEIVLRTGPGSWGLGGWWCSLWSFFSLQDFFT